MLFSQADIARFVNETFEPAWQAVRPVPIVRIDFGNGHVGLGKTLFASYYPFGSEDGTEAVP